LNGRQLARDIGISHTTYHKFKRGEPTAEWIREAIMKVAHRKHQKLEELKAIAKD
jgi:DNA-binding Xre family transcriptional regulator